MSEGSRDRSAKGALGEGTGAHPDRFSSGRSAALTLSLCREEAQALHCLIATCRRVAISTDEAKGLRLGLQEGNGAGRKIQALLGALEGALAATGGDPALVKIIFYTRRPVFAEWMSITGVRLAVGPKSTPLTTRVQGLPSMLRRQIQHVQQRRKPQAPPEALLLRVCARRARQASPLCLPL